MNEEIGIKKKSMDVKKKRRSKFESKIYELNKKQTKFFVDLSKHKNELEKVQELLVKANNKSFGEEITFRELAMFLIDKLAQKDIEKLQDNSLSFEDKLKKEHQNYLTRTGNEIPFFEYLAKHHKGQSK